MNAAKLKRQVQRYDELRPVYSIFAEVIQKLLSQGVVSRPRGRSRRWCQRGRRRVGLRARCGHRQRADDYNGEDAARDDCFLHLICLLLRRLFGISRCLCLQAGVNHL